MGRRPGSRNADYAEERERILGRLAREVGLAGRGHLSFRELAQVAGVTPSTLRHYLGRRGDVLSATLARLRQGGAPFVAAAATEDHGSAAESLAWLVAFLRRGWDFGVGKAHAFGIAEGLGEPALGRSYLRDVLEPTLQAAEARIARHVARGELGPCDFRHAALELLAPVVLALLHQQLLCGAEVRPLDLDRFVEDHLSRFLRAHAPARPRRRP
ncbi:MAG TPA: TetR/AcrR family transcriptional regulator, partial [Anaeromyxobacter sp.]